MDDCKRPRWLCKILEVGTDAVIPDGVSVKADNEASVDAADRLAGLSKKKIEEGSERSLSVTDG